jgi:hypothetical protein
MASRTSKEAIKSDGDGINEIVFAIPSSGRQSKANLEAFESTFNAKQTFVAGRAHTFPAVVNF